MAKKKSLTKKRAKARAKKKKKARAVKKLKKFISDEKKFGLGGERENRTRAASRKMGFGEKVVSGSFNEPDQNTPVVHRLMSMDNVEHHLRKKKARKKKERKKKESGKGRYD